MKILQISAADSKGGVGKIVYRFNNYLKELGHQTSIFVGFKYSNLKEVFLIKKPNSLLLLANKIAKKNVDGFLRRKLAYFLADDIDLFSIDDLFKSKEYKEADVIHLNNLHGDYFKLKDLRRISREKKVVWTIHDFWAITGHCAYPFDCQKWQTGCKECPALDMYPKIAWDNTKYLWSQKKKIYEDSKLNVVAYSLWTKNTLDKSILKNQNISLIYNGIDDRIFKPYDKAEVRKELGLPLDKKIILYVAVDNQNDPRKGWYHVAKMIEKYKDVKDILFISIGSKRQYKEGNLWYFSYIGSDELLSKFYSAADVFISPSSAETFGYTIAESMSCGTPVVAFESGAIPEIIVHKETGYLVSDKNDKGLEEGVDYILKLSKEEYQKVSENSVKRIREKFHWRKMMEEYINLYKTITN